MSPSLGGGSNPLLCNCWLVRNKSFRDDDGEIWWLVMMTDGWRQTLADHSHLVGEAYKSLASQQILPVGPPRRHLLRLQFCKTWLLFHRKKGKKWSPRTSICSRSPVSHVIHPWRFSKRVCKKADIISCIYNSLGQKIKILDLGFALHRAVLYRFFCMFFTVFSSWDYFSLIE